MSDNESQWEDVKSRLSTTPRARKSAFGLKRQVEYDTPLRPHTALDVSTDESPHSLHVKLPPASDCRNTATPMGSISIPTLAAPTSLQSIAIDNGQVSFVSSIDEKPLSMNRLNSMPLLTARKKREVRINKDIATTSAPPLKLQCLPGIAMCVPRLIPPLKQTFCFFFVLVSIIPMLNEALKLITVRQSLPLSDSVSLNLDLRNCNLIFDQRDELTFPEVTIRTWAHTLDSFSWKSVSHDPLYTLTTKAATVRVHRSRPSSYLPVRYPGQYRFENIRIRSVLNAESTLIASAGSIQVNHQIDIDVSDTDVMFNRVCASSFNLVINSGYLDMGIASDCVRQPEILWQENFYLNAGSTPVVIRTDMSVSFSVPENWLDRMIMHSDGDISMHSSGGKASVVVTDSQAGHHHTRASLTCELVLTNTPVYWYVLQDFDMEDDRAKDKVLKHWHGELHNYFHWTEDSTSRIIDAVNWLGWNKLAPYILWIEIKGPNSHQLVDNSMNRFVTYPQIRWNLINGPALSSPWLHLVLFNGGILDPKIHHYGMFCLLENDSKRAYYGLQNCKDQLIDKQSYILKKSLKDGDPAADYVLEILDRNRQYVKKTKKQDYLPVSILINYLISGALTIIAVYRTGHDFQKYVFDGYLKNKGITSANSYRLDHSINAQNGPLDHTSRHGWHIMTSHYVHPDKYKHGILCRWAEDKDSSPYQHMCVIIRDVTNAKAGSFDKRKLPLKLLVPQTSDNLIGADEQTAQLLPAEREETVLAEIPQTSFAMVKTASIRSDEIAYWVSSNEVKLIETLAGYRRELCIPAIKKKCRGDPKAPVWQLSTQRLYRVRILKADDSMNIISASNWSDPVSMHAVYNPHNYNLTMIAALRDVTLPSMRYFISKCCKQANPFRMMLDITDIHLVPHSTQVCTEDGYSGIIFGDFDTDQMTHEIHRNITMLYLPLYRPVPDDKVTMELAGKQFLIGVANKQTQQWTASAKVDKSVFISQIVQNIEAPDSYQPLEIDLELFNFEGASWGYFKCMYHPSSMKSIIQPLAIQNDAPISFDTALAGSTVIIGTNQVMQWTLKRSCSSPLDESSLLEMGLMDVETNATQAIRIVEAGIQRLTWTVNCTFGVSTDGYRKVCFVALREGAIIAQSHNFFLVSALTLSEFEFAYAAFCRSHSLEMHPVSSVTMNQLGLQLDQVELRCIPNVRRAMPFEHGTGVTSPFFYTPGQTSVQTSSILTELKDTQYLPFCESDLDNGNLISVQNVLLESSHKSSEHHLDILKTENVATSVLRNVILEPDPYYWVESPDIMLGDLLPPWVITVGLNKFWKFSVIPTILNTFVGFNRVVTITLLPFVVISMIFIHDYVSRSIYRDRSKDIDPSILLDHLIARDTNNIVILSFLLSLVLFMSLPAMQTYLHQLIRIYTFTLLTIFLFVTFSSLNWLIIGGLISVVRFIPVSIFIAVICWILYSRHTHYEQSRKFIYTFCNDNSDSLLGICLSKWQMAHQSSIRRAMVIRRQLPVHTSTGELARQPSLDSCLSLKSPTRGMSTKDSDIPLPPAREDSKLTNLLKSRKRRETHYFSQHDVIDASSSRGSVDVTALAKLSSMPLSSTWHDAIPRKMTMGDVEDINREFVFEIGGEQVITHHRHAVKTLNEARLKLLFNTMAIANHSSRACAMYLNNPHALSQTLDSVRKQFLVDLEQQPTSIEASPEDSSSVISSDDEDSRKHATSPSVPFLTAIGATYTRLIGEIDEQLGINSVIKTIDSQVTEFYDRVIVDKITSKTKLILQNLYPITTTMSLHGQTKSVLNQANVPKTGYDALSKVQSLISQYHQSLSTIQSTAFDKQGGELMEYKIMVVATLLFEANILKKSDIFYKPFKTELKFQSMIVTKGSGLPLKSAIYPSRAETSDLIRAIIQLHDNGRKFTIDLIDVVIKHLLTNYLWIDAFVLLLRVLGVSDAQYAVPCALKDSSSVGNGNIEVINARYIQKVFDKLSNHSCFLRSDLADEAVLLLTENQLSLSGGIACVVHIGLLTIDESVLYDVNLELQHSLHDSRENVFDWSLYLMDIDETEDLLYHFDTVSGGFIPKAKLLDCIHRYVLTTQLILSHELLAGQLGLSVSPAMSSFIRSYVNHMIYNADTNSDDESRGPPHTSYQRSFFDPRLRSRIKRELGRRELRNHRATVARLLIDLYFDPSFAVRTDDNKRCAERFNGSLNKSMFFMLLQELRITIKEPEKLWNAFPKTPLFHQVTRTEWMIDQDASDPFKGHTVRIADIHKYLPQFLETGMWNESIEYFLKHYLSDVKCSEPIWWDLDDGLVNQYGLFRVDGLINLLRELQGRKMTYRSLDETIKSMKIRLPDSLQRRMFSEMDINHDMHLDENETFNGFEILFKHYVPDYLISQLNLTHQDEIQHIGLLVALYLVIYLFVYLAKLCFSSFVNTELATGLIAMAGVISFRDGEASQNFGQDFTALKVKLNEKLYEIFDENIEEQLSTQRKMSQLWQTANTSHKPRASETNATIHYHGFPPGTTQCLMLNLDVHLYPRVVGIDDQCVRWSVNPDIRKLLGLSFNERTGLITGRLSAKSSTLVNKLVIFTVTCALAHNPVVTGKLAFTIKDR